MFTLSRAFFPSLKGNASRGRTGDEISVYLFTLRYKDQAKIKNIK
jgi:hypothetical protein